MLNAISLISSFAMPAMVCLILVWGLRSGTEVYSCFLEGATDGLKIGFQILPPIIGLLVAIGMFRASGALDLVTFALKPITDFLHFPPEVVPFALLRPMSGGGSLALATDLFRTHGTDSFIGRAVSVMMGSTETTFYTLAVYFGAVGITQTRHTVKCALLADLTGIFLSIWVCFAIFGA